MKRIYNSIQVMGLAFLFCLALSCSKDFLEITPKGKLIAKSVADYDLLLNNLELLNVNTDAQILLGDEVAAIEPLFSGSALRAQRLFRGEDVIYEPEENAVEMDVPMKNIYLYNKIINEIGQATEGNENQKKALLAEARAGRAWTYHLLINYFGKPYDPATAATDLGFPIIREADVTAISFSRATVKEVYDFIISDLESSIPDLPQGTSHRLRMSRPAAEAILGKVFLYMGRFKEAEQMLSASIKNISSAKIPISLYDYNVTFGTEGEFMPIGMFGPEYPTAPYNRENLFAKQFFNPWSFFNSEIVISPATRALYQDSDLRLNFYSNAAFAGEVYPSNLHRRVGPSSSQIGMLLPDIYLMRAECRGRAGNLDGAVQDVEWIRKHRIPVKYAAVPEAIASEKELLVKFILDERIREFAGHGYRWFDMRRLSVDPLYRSTVGYAHTLYSPSGSIDKTFTIKPERLVLRLPEKIIIQNPGMSNNP